MTPEDLMAKGYAALSDLLQMPQEEDVLESMIRQLRTGRYQIDFHIYQPDAEFCQIWARPVTQAYGDKL